MTFRIPTEIPLSEYPKPEEFIQEAERLASEASKEGIMLRVMGGMAIYMHSRDCEELWNNLKRLGDRVFTDIDFVSYGQHREKMIGLMKKYSYQMDPRLQFAYGKTRQIYFGGRVPMVEIFYDRLVMNHTIEYAGRLEVDNPTVPLIELLLQKLQIVKINEKDQKDMVILIRAHDIGKDDNQKINLKGFDSAEFGEDWGFYFTAVTNLQKVLDFLPTNDALSENDKKIVSERVAAILDYLEKMPKSLKWKMRAKVGPKKKWYDDVDEW